jgi:uncharacterized membrane protein
MKKIIIISVTLFIFLIGFIWWFFYQHVNESFFEAMPHHNYYPFEYWPFFFLRGLFIPFILLGLIIAFFILTTLNSKKNESSLSILNSRLARGELSIEEYKKIKELTKRGDYK